MRLVDNWHEVMRYAWSVRLILLAALLSGLEFAVQVLVAFAVPLPLPPGLLALGAFLLSIAAFVARLIAQRRVRP